MNVTTIRRPSAWIPVAMSVAALAIVLVHVARFGVAREADEGTAAHVWQILMAGQLPIIAWFARRLRLRIREYSLGSMSCTGVSEPSIAAFKTRTSSFCQRSAMAPASLPMPSPSVRSTGAIVAVPPAEWIRHRHQSELPLPQRTPVLVPRPALQYRPA